MTNKVIFDCDNTMGIPGCDIDDGLALLYLLGKRVDIVGITTTFGNSDIEAVTSCTQKLLLDIQRRDIPLLRGCPDKNTLQSEAADYLVKTVDQNAGEISILATGSLTNLYAAYLADQSFFDKVREIIIMGGITEDLIINGSLLDELNFSCDPGAAECVLRNGRNVTVITGNNCLDAFFTKEEFEEKLSGNNFGAKYIMQKCSYWFKDMMTRFNLPGFHNWDVVAAAYLVNPALFTDSSQYIKADSEKIKQGRLEIIDPAYADSLVNIPKIKNVADFSNDVYHAWLNAFSPI